MSVSFQTPLELVITTRQVLREGWPILLVTHDADDGGWQFLNGHGDTDDVADALLVRPERLVGLDPSVGSLVDLPLGWRAWRVDPSAAWTREPDPGHLR